MRCIEEERESSTTRQMSRILAFLRRWFDSLRSAMMMSRRDNNKNSLQQGRRMTFEGGDFSGRGFGSMWRRRRSNKEPSTEERRRLREIPPLLTLRPVEDSGLENNTSGCDDGDSPSPQRKKASGGGCEAGDAECVRFLPNRGRPRSGGRGPPDVFLHHHRSQPHSIQQQQSDSRRRTAVTTSPFGSLREEEPGKRARLRSTSSSCSWSTTTSEVGFPPQAPRGRRTSSTSTTKPPLVSEFAVPNRRRYTARYHSLDLLGSNNNHLPQWISGRNKMAILEQQVVPRIEVKRPSSSSSEIPSVSGKDNNNGEKNLDSGVFTGSSDESAATGIIGVSKERNKTSQEEDTNNKWFYSVSSYFEGKNKMLMEKLKRTKSLNEKKKKEPCSGKISTSLIASPDATEKTLLAVPDSARSREFSGGSSTCSLMSSPLSSPRRIRFIRRQLRRHTFGRVKHFVVHSSKRDNSDDSGNNLVKARKETQLMRSMMASPPTTTVRKQCLENGKEGWRVRVWVRMDFATLQFCHVCQPTCNFKTDVRKLRAEATAAERESGDGEVLWYRYLGR